jgi:hypothetical protein
MVEISFVKLELGPEKVYHKICKISGDQKRKRERRIKMSNLKKYDLLELPWTDVADYIRAGNDVVMIPIGSCEKHGNHVPLGVDSYTTMGSVERAAVKAKVLIHPCCPLVFPLTIWVRPAGGPAASPFPPRSTGKSSTPSVGA